jgi:EAL domain-containing protein (putative c-di-GMP-specific phosphodiesterase class I)
VAAVSGRVLGVVAQPVELGGRRIVVTGSVGVVVASGGEAPADLLRDADVAMYRSKGDGRGRATRFTEGLRAEAVARLEQEADLRHALEQGHLELHYQPIVSAGDGTVVAVEALVRWRHPDRGLLVPADFLPVAERSGLVVDLGTAVLGQACADLARWRAAGHELRVSVNLSPRQLHHEELVRTVLATCDRTGADPAGLVLELTEDALIEALGVAGAHLRDLRRHGALVALDDFGTGYSSLQYLRDLPVDMVKIDRSFVSGLGAGDDGALAEAIVGLAAALGLVSVAEGVERVDQLRRLQAMGCEMVQGYLLGRPVPLEELDLTPRR